MPSLRITMTTPGPSIASIGPSLWNRFLPPFRSFIFFASLSSSPSRLNSCLFPWAEMHWKCFCFFSLRVRSSLYKYICTVQYHTLQHNTIQYSTLHCNTHWRRLVKNIGWANQNIGGQKVVKSYKYMGVSQSLRLCMTMQYNIYPQIHSYRLWRICV